MSNEQESYSTAQFLRDRARQRRVGSNQFANHARRENAPSPSPHESVASPTIEEAINAPQEGSASAGVDNELEVVSDGVGHVDGGASASGGQEAQLLDAYWASFGDPGIRAFASNITEVVIGSDDRVEVGPTDRYPWRAIASLLLTAADGTNWIGTGWMVSPRLMLTAGHCVFMSDHGGWCRQIEVIPGRKGGTRPYESCIATDYRSVSGWTRDGNRIYDYAAILLPESCRYGERVGWFGYQNYSDDQIENRRINISGYPGDKPSGTQWFHSNGLTDVDDDVLEYEADTAGGQSGAPVWVKNSDGSRYGVGIHTNGSLAGNSATRINAGVLENINNWRALVP